MMSRLMLNIHRQASHHRRQSTTDFRGLGFTDVINGLELAATPTLSDSDESGTAASQDEHAVKPKLMGLVELP